VIFHKQRVADEIIRIRMSLDEAQTEYTPKTELTPDHARAIARLVELESDYRFVARLGQLCFVAHVKNVQEKIAKEAL